MYVGNLRGEQGGEYISDALTHTGSWACGYCVTDVVISDITQGRFANEVCLVGQTLLAGMIIWGSIQSIKLTSGTIQMFNHIDKTNYAS